MRHLVVGKGEVGRAIHAVLGLSHEVDIRDVEPSDATADVLHICFPWSDDFEGAVKGYIAEHDADLVIVHSTVPVGTCDPHGWVHSPVTGRHPRLEESLKTFCKRAGGRRAAEAAAIFDQAGLRTYICDRARDTEAGKLWELIQFGVQVRVCQAIYDWCEQNGCDPEAVYRDFGHHYNTGYTALGHHELRRPVLEHVPGPIGGHCVTQCSGLLDHPLARMVTE